MSKLLLLALASGSVLLACSSTKPSQSTQTQPAETEPTAPASAFDGPAAVAAWEADMADQRQLGMTRLYDDNCAKCHGANGQGGGAGTKSLLSREKFDQKHDKPYFDAIKNGVKDMGMEAYGTTLSDPEIWGLVVHIRELQAKHLRATEGGPKSTNGVFRSKHHPYRIETVIEEGLGLVTPWAIDWLPDGKMLVTSRPGHMNLFQSGQVGPNIQGLPAVVELGQGGLMEVAVHPGYAKNGWVYLAFTDPAANGNGGMTKLVRGKLKISGLSATWTNQETIFQADQSTYTRSGVHFGCRIVFDGKGHIYFPIGERGNGNLSQDLSRPNGKVFRVKEDGAIPADNPFASAEWKAKGALGAIWSYGHRNPQGLVMGLDGNLYDTEHGPRGGDEVNRVEKGANYGWPIVAFSINYNDAAYSVPWPKADQPFKLPIYRWLPSIGACGLDVGKGGAFPNWKGDLFAGGLSGANVDRLRIKGEKLIEVEEIVFGMGRVRDVSIHRDGTIYVALNQPDKVVRVVPAK